TSADGAVDVGHHPEAGNGHIGDATTATDEVSALNYSRGKAHRRSADRAIESFEIVVDEIGAVQADYTALISSVLHAEIPSRVGLLDRVQVERQLRPLVLDGGSVQDLQSRTV